MCLPNVPRYGSCPGVWLIYQVFLYWQNRVVSAAIKYQSSLAKGGNSCLPPFLHDELLSGLSFVGLVHVVTVSVSSCLPLPCCVSRTPHLALTIFLSPFQHGSISLEGWWGMIEKFHLMLKVPTSFIPCMLPSSGSLLTAVSCKKQLSGEV